MLIYLQDGVSINPEFITSTEWIKGEVPGKAKWRIFKVTMCTGAIHHVEAAPKNCGANEIAARIQKFHRETETLS